MKIEKNGSFPAPQKNGVINKKWLNWRNKKKGTLTCVEIENSNVGLLRPWDDIFINIIFRTSTKKR